MPTCTGGLAARTSAGLSAAVDDVLLAVHRRQRGGRGLLPLVLVRRGLCLSIGPPSAVFLARERTKVAPRGDVIPRALR